jgi:hypothetical protein
MFEIRFRQTLQDLHQWQSTKNRNYPGKHPLPLLLEVRLPLYKHSCGISELLTAEATGISKEIWIGNRPSLF